MKTRHWGRRIIATWGVLTMVAGGMVVTATAASADVADFLPLRVAGATVSSTWGHAGSHPQPYAIDIAVPTGTQVIASGHGEVIGVGTDSLGSKFVSIYHKDENRTSQYLHLSSMQVRVGQRVTTGQDIAKSGATGNVTGPHLHYQEQAGRVVVPNRNRVNPGTLYACQGSSLVSYQTGPGMRGATVRNDGPGCIGKTPPKPGPPKPYKPTKFGSDARSQLYVTRSGDLNLDVCGSNIAGQELRVQVSRPGRRFDIVTARPDRNCYTFRDLDGAGPVLRSTFYESRLAMNQNPNRNWPIPCGARTGSQGLCDRVNT